MNANANHYQVTRLHINGDSKVASWLLCIMTLKKGSSKILFSSRKVEIFTQLITRPITLVKSYTTFSNVFASTLLECNRSYTRGMHSKNEASISFFEMFNVNKIPFSS